MSIQAPEEKVPSWKIAGVVSFYMAVALIMVMVNKWVLNTNDSLPLTFLFLQLSISVLLLYILPFTPLKFQVPRFDRAVIKSMLPVSAINVFGLIFNIYCLKMVDASYFQVARGLTLPMTVVLSAVFFREMPTYQTIACCSIVTLGFTYSYLPLPWLDGYAVGGARGGEAPLLGMILGVLSAFMVALHAVFIKSALKILDGKALDLAYWQNLLSGMALGPLLLLSGEVMGIWRLCTGQEGNLSAFAIGSIVTGVVGFFICVAGFLSIKVTSPTTHMFSAAVRTVLQTFLGVQLFGDIINSSRAVSIFLILLGSCMYTYHRANVGPGKPMPSGKEDIEMGNGTKGEGAEATQSLLSGRNSKGDDEDVDQFLKEMGESIEHHEDQSDDPPSKANNKHRDSS